MHRLDFKTEITWPYAIPSRCSFQSWSQCSACKCRYIDSQSSSLRDTVQACCNKATSCLPLRRRLKRNWVRLANAGDLPQCEEHAQLKRLKEPPSEEAIHWIQPISNHTDLVFSRSRILMPWPGRLRLVRSCQISEAKTQSAVVSAWVRDHQVRATT